MKILCVLLPHFPINCEKLRTPVLKERPVIITYVTNSQKFVLDYSPELKGLQRDMPLQQALSMEGETELIHADIPYYQSVFNDILDSLEKVSPLVEGSSLGDIYIGLDGLQLLYGNDDNIVNAIRSAIPVVFEARLGIAGNKFMAYLAALHSPHNSYQTLMGDITSFLKELSCDLLPVSLKSKEKLHNFGLHKLGQISSLSLGAMQAQFGPEGKKIWELAHGQDPTLLLPRMTKEDFEEHVTLPSMTSSLDVMIIAIEAVLSHAFSWFESRGIGISCINLRTKSWQGEYWEKNIRFKEPAMNIKTALSRIKLIIENSLQPGPTEQVGMKITGLGRPNGRQKSILADVRAKDNLLDDVRQLEFRLGGTQLYRIKEIEPWSRIPERRYALIPLNQ